MPPKYFVSSSPRGMYDSRGSQARFAIPQDPSNSNLGSESIGQFAGLGSFQMNPVFSPKIVEFVNQQEAEEQRRNSQFSFVDGSRCREGSTQEMLESAHQGSQEFPEGQKEAVNASAHGSHPRMLSVGAFSRHDPQPTPPDWQSSQHPPYSNHLSNVPSS